MESIKPTWKSSRELLAAACRYPRPLPHREYRVRPRYHPCRCRHAPGRAWSRSHRCRRGSRSHRHLRARWTDHRPAPAERSAAPRSQSTADTSSALTSSSCAAKLPGSTSACAGASSSSDRSKSAGRSRSAAGVSSGRSRPRSDRSLAGWLSGASSSRLSRKSSASSLEVAAGSSRSRLTRTDHRQVATLDLVIIQRQIEAQIVIGGSGRSSGLVDQAKVQIIFQRKRRFFSLGRLRSLSRSASNHQG
jgi:hypothetical protein